ncbi:alpha/beta hydrolase [Phyllobacterium myrsinacearum]|uniref:Putative esterase n=1 Tax=Phyllobacterium myrsinacearum TaxID=28101 RepID=A0A839EQT3_9HYPH|nr:alpha/beta hydrolase [Phyllobacterium myrsinacearum]MBA8880588.1 putative esterase [Phyllobacterium myrsinacearum]
MGKPYLYALIAGLSLAGAYPASASVTADCDKPVVTKAQILTGAVDPLANTGKNSTGACVQKPQAAMAAPEKAKPINIVATGSAGILKKAVKGEILPQGESALRDDLAFKYRIYRPEDPNGDTMVLLHGSGQDETSLVSLATKIAPNALLLAVRGRIVQDGTSRWYRRLTPVSFDQKDIHFEAKAFAGFLKQATEKYKIDLKRTTYLGYSNGANLVGAVMMLYPDMVKQAVLLRSMPVLTENTDANLAGARVLTVSGASDQTYAPFAPALETLLRTHGALVEARSIKSDHGLGSDDVKVVSEWLSGATAQLKKN